MAAAGPPDPGPVPARPITIAIPSDLDGPLYLDMATSAAAAGKIAVAVARNDGVEIFTHA